MRDRAARADPTVRSGGEPTPPDARDLPAVRRQVIADPRSRLAVLPGIEEPVAVTTHAVAAAQKLAADPVEGPTENVITADVSAWRGSRFEGAAVDRGAVARFVGRRRRGRTAMGRKLAAKAGGGLAVGTSIEKSVAVPPDAGTANEERATIAIEGPAELVIAGDVSAWRGPRLEGATVDRGTVARLVVDHTAVTGSVAAVRIFACRFRPPGVVAPR